jgi:Tfp pilus assembly protein PilF
LTSTATTQPSDAKYVGHEVCAACHRAEFQRWRDSDHALAMQIADPSTIRGNFDNATYTYNGITSRFYRRGGKYFVRTDGADGALHEYEIAYTFGIRPLQQYLVAFPGGRYQVLSIAWDTRPKAAGGRRWFHMYPNEKVVAGDVLHWTRLSQNWNYQCAECHSTNLRKNYKAAEQRYETTWSEINVSCEACHGPGSAHVEWARSAQRGGSPGAGLPNIENKQDSGSRGLVRLGAHDGAVWTINPATGIAHRDRPRTSRLEVEMCARCHARRGTLTDAYIPGRPLADTHRPALLDETLYYADGQILDEVYEYASFRQSKMYAQGVTCSDCHEPHALRVGDAPNDVCARCHLSARFSTPAHHHHKAESKGASCVACHMPTRTYMVVDPRYDHSFRIPRPDLTQTAGTPNACTECHRDRSAQWAADAVTKWYGDRSNLPPHYGIALHEGRTRSAGAERALAAVANDAGSTPAIVRATALSLLRPILSPLSTPVVESGLRDEDPLVRAAAIETTEALDPATRARLVEPLLTDSVRLVRIQAGRALATVPDSLMPEGRLAARQRALDEWIAVQQEQADTPGAHINLGALSFERRDYPRARQEFEAALAIEPSFVPASVNLADLYREQGQDEEGERVLRRALARTPDQADLHHALGLLLARQHRASESMAELERAALLQPDNPRLAYVLAIDWYSNGRRDEAVHLLERTYKAHDGDRDVLSALVAYTREAGKLDLALDYARKLALLAPADAEVRALVAQLEAAVGRE